MRNVRELIRPEWIFDAFRVGKVIAMVAIPTSLLVLHVYHQYQITKVGYEIASVTSEHRELLEENKKLTVEARIQGRSDRVAEVARRQFGLRETSPEQVITVEVTAEQRGLEELAVVR